MGGKKIIIWRILIIMLILYDNLFSELRELIAYITSTRCKDAYGLTFNYSFTRIVQTSYTDTYILSCDDSVRLSLLIDYKNNSFKITDSESPKYRECMEAQIIRAVLTSGWGLYRNFYEQSQDAERAEE